MYMSKLVKIGKLYAKLANTLLDSEDHITILLQNHLLVLSKQILNLKESTLNGSVPEAFLNKLQSSLIRLNGLALGASISSKDYQTIIEAERLLQH